MYQTEVFMQTVFSHKSEMLYVVINASIISLMQTLDVCSYQPIYRLQYVFIDLSIVGENI